MNYYNRNLILSGDELMHYGVLGMKWGHRKSYYKSNGIMTRKGRKKFLDEHGNLNEKGKRMAYDDKGRQTDFGEKYDRYKAARDAHSEYHKLGDEFRKTPNGKALVKAYDKASKKYFNSNSDSPRLEKDFTKAEKALLKSEQEYVARKMVKKYSLQTLNDIEKMFYKGSSEYKNVDQYVQETINEWKLHTE